MARTPYSLVALLQLMLAVAQVTAVDVNVGQALVVPPGDNATLQCSYTTTQSASSGSLTWSFNNGSGDVTFYQRLGSTEIPSAGYQDRVTFIGNLSNGIANIHLSNMQEGDSGSYTCLVIVFGDGQDSKSISVTVRGPTTGQPPVTVIKVVNMTIPVPGDPVDPAPVLIFTFQALGAAIIMILILVADKYKEYDMVKKLAFGGPLCGALLAVAVIIICVTPFSGNGYQHGFLLITFLSGVAAGMSVLAAGLGYLFKKSDLPQPEARQEDNEGNEVNFPSDKKADFPVATMGLEFSLGVMIAAAGIVVPGFYKLTGTGVAAIVVAVICLALLVAAFIWFMVRVCLGNRQSSRVSQDLSEARSQNQVELEHRSAQAGEKTAKPAQQPPVNEVIIQDSLSNPMHGRHGMLKPLPHVSTKQKKKKEKRKTEAEKEDS